MANNDNLTTIEKWRELVIRVISNTKKGDISWKTTSDDEAFLARIGTTSVEVSTGYASSPDFEGDEPVPVVTFKIFDKNGNIVDRFNDEDLGKPEMYREMVGFHSYLIRKLSGAEDYLDELLELLPNDSDDDEVIPF